DLEAAAIIQHGGVAADGEGNLGLTTGDINPDRRARSIGIDRRAIRLLYLKQFHDLTNTLWTSAVSAACGRGCPRSGYRRSNVSKRGKTRRSRNGPSRSGCGTRTPTAASPRRSP